MGVMNPAVPGEAGLRAVEVAERILAAESRMIMFVVSMVDPQKPLIRAFYEGLLEQEIPIDFVT